MDPVERDHFLAVEYSYAGHCGEDAFLYYRNDQCCARVTLALPEDKTYSIDVIDTWNMTISRAQTGAQGKARVEMPGRPWMAVLAVRER